MEVGGVEPPSEASYHISATCLVILQISLCYTRLTHPAQLSFKS